MEAVKNRLIHFSHVQFNAIKLQLIDHYIIYAYGLKRRITRRTCTLKGLRGFPSFILQKHGWQLTAGTQCIHWLVDELIGGVFEWLSG